MRQKVSLCLIKFSERDRRIILELLSFNTPLKRGFKNLVEKMNEKYFSLDPI